MSRNDLFRTVTTGPSGNYRFAYGERDMDHIVGVTSKRYRVTQVFNTLADVEFVGLE